MTPREIWFPSRKAQTSGDTLGIMKTDLQRLQRARKPCVTNITRSAEEFRDISEAQKESAKFMTVKKLVTVIKC